MKKTQWSELIHTILKTKVTFIAIILFVTMGLTLFFGLSWSSDAIKLSSNDYFNTGKLNDLDIQYVYGFNDKIIDDIKNTLDVSFVEGYYKDYEFLNLNGKKYEVRITSLTNNINKAVKIIGDIPSKLGEIAIEEHWANENNIKVGDTIEFEPSNVENNYLPTIINSTKENIINNLIQDMSSSSKISYLKTNTFKVTCLVETANYLSVIPDMYGISFPQSIPVNVVMFANINSFNTSYFPGYTNIAVKINNSNNNYFSKNYIEDCNKLKDKIKVKLNTYTDNIYDELKGKEEILKQNYIDYQFENYICNISTSNDNSSVIALKMLMDIFDELKFSMAGLFVIIGLLVCYFTISRIVYDNKKFIGTKKALGFRKSEITATYLLYAILATLVGGIIGCLGARFIVEPILVNAIGQSYIFNSYIYSFELIPVIIYIVIEIILQCLAVYISSRRLFKMNTLSLLKEEEENINKIRFYEKTKFWKKIPLFTKIIINNIIKNKRRVLSTIVSVAACSSLVICAITLNNNIVGSFDKQYDSVYKFNGIIYFDTSKNFVEIEDVLNEKNIPFTRVYSTYVSLNLPNGKSLATNLMVTKNKDVYEFLSPNDLKNGNNYEKGLWSSCSYFEEYGKENSEKITFVDDNNKIHNLKVEGYFEYYLINNLLILDAETYESEFNKKFSPNTYFINLENFGFDELSKDLSKLESFICLSNDYELSKISFDEFASVFSIIVAVYLVIAASMALLILLNLFVMFVSEKKKEILTMLVNGYSRNFTKRYIWVDILLLSIIGILLGILFGTIMANISLKAYKNETLYFLSGLDIKASILGVVITALFTLGTTLLALRKISKLKLNELNVE